MSFGGVSWKRLGRGRVLSSCRGSLSAGMIGRVGLLVYESLVLWRVFSFSLSLADMGKMI